MEKNIYKFLFPVFIILIAVSIISVEGNENFMRKILQKCSKKLRKYEKENKSGDVMDMKTKLLAKAVPPTKLEGKTSIW